MAFTEQKTVFDPISMYHHVVSFNPKLRNLLSILELPMEHNIQERFKNIESILDPTFRLEIIHHLNLKHDHSLNSENESSVEHHAHPQILLHLWCLLECTNSLDIISKYLGLELEEIEDLIRELHHTFSIDSLISRIHHYFKQNKDLKELQLKKKSEFLGFEPVLEPKDSNEARRQRIRRRYGHLSDVFFRT